MRFHLEVFLFVCLFFLLIILTGSPLKPLSVFIVFIEVDVDRPWKIENARNIHISSEES